MEKTIFESGYHTNDKRITFCSLQNRYVFLTTTSSVIRGETLFNGELSDQFGVDVPMSPDKFYVQILQMTQGKRHPIEYKLFCRIGRHIDPSRCSIGANAFYLIYRFHHLNEMSPPPDFWVNDSWYSIKILTEFCSTNNTISISTQTYCNTIKAFGEKLGIPTNHYVHIGRVLGSVKAQFKECDSEDLRNLGNWENCVHTSHYGLKLPLKILRKKAGFFNGKKCHFHPRTTLEPPAELTKQVFPWLDQAWDSLTSHTNYATLRPTAHQFLKMMKFLCVVSLQDAAALLLKDPSCITHPLFQIPPFTSPLFTSYVQKMGNYLKNSVSPADVSLEQVLPTVNNHFTTLHAGVKRGFDQMADKVDCSFGTIEDKLQALPETIQQKTQEVSEQSLLAVL